MTKDQADQLGQALRDAKVGCQLAHVHIDALLPIVEVYPRLCAHLEAQGAIIEALRARVSELEARVSELEPADPGPEPQP